MTEWLKRIYPEKILEALTPKTIKRAKNPYPSFNTRMLASIIDTVLFTLLFAPIFDMLSRLQVNAPQMDWSILQQQMSKLPQGEAMQLFWQSMRESGMLMHMLGNMLLQTLLLSMLMIIMWRWRNATPGKLLLKMRVVDARSGGKMSIGQSVLRVLGYFVNIVPGSFIAGLLWFLMPASWGIMGLFILLPLSVLLSMAGFFWIAIDPKRRGWHDYLANTVVIFTTQSYRNENIEAINP